MLAGLFFFPVFTCVRAVGEKQSGVEMQGRERSCRIGGWDQRGVQNGETKQEKPPKNVDFSCLSLCSVCGLQTDADSGFSYAFSAHMKMKTKA